MFGFLLDQVPEHGEFGNGRLLLTSQLLLMVDHMDELFDLFVVI